MVWTAPSLGPLLPRALRCGANVHLKRLPACQTILNVIGNFLADGCQVEQFLFAEDIFGFRQVADTSPPRVEGNHPNPCLPWRVRPLLMAQDDKDKIRRRSASTITPPTA